MATKFRVASFNVENLFSRAKLLNYRNNTIGEGHLNRLEEFKTEIKKATYDKPKILALYSELKDFIHIIETREKLFNKAKTQVVASGVNSWDGVIELKRDKFEEESTKNTAKVIKTVSADICCLIEVEDRPLLRHFSTNFLTKTTTFTKYNSLMCIDGNDDRGIDVAVASRFPFDFLRSHVDDVDAKGEIFSRDCLEIEVKLPNNKSLWLLANHLKSKGYGEEEANNAKRLRQSTRIAEILKRFNLKKDLVVVAGDLNDTPESAPLAPLMSLPNLHDVLKLKFPNDPAQRWTYHFKKNEQIDYLLVSEPLKNALLDAGVERRGIYGVEKFTANTIKSFPTVTHYTNSASDHGAVWADFQI